MALHVLVVIVRMLGFMAVVFGVLRLGREQRVTVGRGLAARPRFIALWIGLVVLGAVVAVLPSIVAG